MTLAVAGLALGGCISAPTNDDSPSTSTGSGCVVGHVIDGDTIDVTGCPDAGRIRLLQIDAPEVHPTAECFGPEATDYTTAALLGETVELERDVRDTDPYDRKLRYVWLDGELFNERIVADGFARQVTFPPDVKYEARVLAAQREARQSNRGLWSPASCP